MTIASFANAKYTKYPSNCEYLLSKKTGTITKKDVKCYAKIMSAKMNKYMPKKIDENTKIVEIVPKNVTMIFQIHMSGIKSVKDIGRKQWNQFKKTAINRVRKMYCSSSSPFIGMIGYGLKLKFVYKNLKDGNQFSGGVDKNICKKY